MTKVWILCVFYCWSLFSAGIVQLIDDMQVIVKQMLPPAQITHLSVCPTVVLLILQCDSESLFRLYQLSRYNLHWLCIADCLLELVPNSNAVSVPGRMEIEAHFNVWFLRLLVRQQNALQDCVWLCRHTSSSCPLGCASLDSPSANYKSHGVCTGSLARLHWT